jgi:hypothetical protein
MYTPSLLQPQASYSTCPRRNPKAEPRFPLDFLPQPPKALDIWRIEGEGQDLHPHQRDLNLPLIHLRALLLEFPLEIVVALYIIHNIVVLSQPWESPIRLWMRAPRTL